MKEKKQSRPQRCSILRILLLVICGAVLGFNLYFANANNLVGNSLPMPFGYGAAVVLSGSMEPELSVGDLIIVKKAEAYSTDDVVVFEDSGSLIVHRIIEVDGESVTTKGDANNAADVPIHVSAIRGRVSLRIPYAGSLASFIKTPIGTICVLLCSFGLIEIPHWKERQKDDEEQEKLLDEIRQLKKDLEK